MKKILAIISLFILSACGEERRSVPAQISSIDNLPEMAQQKLRLAVQDLNEKAGEEVIKFAPSGTAGHIAIQFTEKVSSVSSQTQTTTNVVAGRAKVSGDQCSVELANFLLVEGREGLLTSVIWHELGHCRGLTHAQDENEVMSAKSIPLQNISEAALERFIAIIKTGL